MCTLKGAALGSTNFGELYMSGISSRDEGSSFRNANWPRTRGLPDGVIRYTCRYSADRTTSICTGKNVKQIVLMAAQTAKSEPQGPSYLIGSRECFEEEISPYAVDSNWPPLHRLP